MADDFLSNDLQTPLSRPKPTLLKPGPVPVQILEFLLKEWKFFLPAPEVTSNIVRLNQEFGDDFDKRREQRVREREGIDWDHFDLPDDDDPNFQRVVDRLSQVVLHRSDDYSIPMSHQRVVEYYSKFLSERIYNHLAMLADTPHAQEGGTFSISEELSSGIADRIGLGLYLSSRTPEKLRLDTADCLNELAFDFQNWLVQEKEGWYPTTWGAICVSELAQQFINKDGCGQPLILEADTEKKGEPECAPANEGLRDLNAREVGR